MGDFNARIGEGAISGIKQRLFFGLKININWKRYQKYKPLQWILTQLKRDTNNCFGVDTWYGNSTSLLISLGYNSS